MRLKHNRYPLGIHVALVPPSLNPSVTLWHLCSVTQGTEDRDLQEGSNGANWNAHADHPVTPGASEGIERFIHVWPAQHSPNTVMFFVQYNSELLIKWWLEPGRHPRKVSPLLHRLGRSGTFFLWGLSQAVKLAEGDEVPSIEVN